jgi:beta-1,4-mannosyl-glycoprotein beta-1,4-N-acetylglucosaminyltransferase
MKIVDGFVFYNELGMLKYRLEVLYPYVDQFIICESTRTFSGRPKDLWYEKNKERFSKYHDKIVHIIVDDMPVSNNAWDLEKHQRQSISRGFSSMEDSDIILLSDVDEIPNPLLLERMRNTALDRLYCLKQDFYYYGLTTLVNRTWCKAKVFPYSFYKQHPDLELCRMSFFNVAFNDGGWHLSYFGNEQFISNKIKNFSHQEYNSEKYTNEETIAERMKQGINLFDDKKFEVIPIDQNTNLPPKYEFLLECLEELKY